MLRTSKIKPKKGSVSAHSNALKAHSQKQPAHGPKSRLVKSTPGFSVYSDEDLTKAVPKTKGARHNDHFDGVGRGEDIESQVQLVDRRNRENKTLDAVSTKQEGGLFRPSSPVMENNPRLPEVQTPFNNRLISSTPDPDKLLLSTNDAITGPPQGFGVNKTSLPSDPSPQLVPERDTTGTDMQNPPSAINKISSMLLAQRQNQLLWQQQLAQFKQPTVVKVTDMPPSFSAFKPWQQGALHHGNMFGFDKSREGQSDAKGWSESEYDLVLRQNFDQKAMWVTEDQQQALGSESIEVQSSLSGQETGKRSETSSLPYKTVGTSSSDPANDNNSIPVKSNPMSALSQNSSSVSSSQNSSGKEDNNNANAKSTKSASSGSSVHAGYTTKKLAAPKSKTEINSQNKLSSSSKSSTISKPKPGAKALPPNSQEKSGLTKSVGVRNAVNRRPLSKKVPHETGVNEGVKKKKVLHVNLPKDERGIDVPPSFQEDTDLQTVDIYTLPGMPRLQEAATTDINVSAINVSASTCGGEVNSLLSKDSEENGDKPNVGLTSEFPSNSSKEVEFTKISPLDEVANSELDSTLIKQDSPNNSFTKGNDNDYNISSARADSLTIIDEVLKQVGALNKEGAGKEGAEDDKENDEANVNQNYHDDDTWDDDDVEGRRRRGTRFRLRYLEKMADKTLMDIACRLTLKATAVRDKELRDLIDDMIFQIDVALAREDERYHSSHAFFIDENNRLKKRLHTVNCQLEAKERQERQGNLGPGISNNDVMHLERKNLYLRQEKDRLDCQVTNLLEEKAQWLVKQQDLVKTISLKDHEILKLEEKYQTDRKSLHKAVDEAAKNSQGVHLKLSVADMEISNLEQRLKAKDKEIMDLRDTLKDKEEDLKCCTDSRKDKNREIQRLTDLVNTLKAGVDEVVRAYESTALPQCAATTDQRRGIESLQRLVTESISTSNSFSNIPEQIHRDEQRLRNPYPKPSSNGHDFTISTSTRLELPPPPQHCRNLTTDGQYNTHGGKSQHTSHKQHRQPKTHHPPHSGTQHQQQREIPSGHRPQVAHSSRHKQPDDDIIYLDSSVGASNTKGRRSKHDCGRGLTERALADHNRILSPVDRSLWHSLDTGHVMPPFDGEEPYHSDSEIHVSHARHRRKQEQERRLAAADVDDPWTRRQRRKSDEFIVSRKRRRCGENRLEEFGDVSRGGGGGGCCGSGGGRRRNSRDEVYPSTQQRGRGREGGGGGGRKRSTDRDREESECRRYVADYGDDNNEDAVDLESIPAYGDDRGHADDVDRSRYSVTDYFQKYPSNVSHLPQPPQNYPTNSKDYWVDSGTVDEQNATLTNHHRHHCDDDDDDGAAPYDSSRGFRSNEKYPSIESLSVSDYHHHHHHPSNRDVEDFDSRRREKEVGGGGGVYTSTQRPHKQQQQPSNFSRQSSREGRDGVRTNEGFRSISPPHHHHHHHHHDLPPPPNHHHPEQQHLSASYSGGCQPEYPANTSEAPYPTMMSTSLPVSSHPYSDRKSHTRNDMESSSNLSPRISSHQQSYHPTCDNLRGSVREKSPSSRSNKNPYVENVIPNRIHNGHPYPKPARERHYVTFRDPSEESLLQNPSQSFQSDFLNGRTSFPPHSSPLNTSDISVSRRATRGSDEAQHDFFRGTELSASCSSISESELLPPLQDYSNNQQPAALGYGEESFNTGIASLDSKIAQLEAKINRTKKAFS